MSQPSRSELDAGIEISSTNFEDPFAYAVWKSTYKHHTDDSIEDTLRRVAQVVASAESTEFKQAEWVEKGFDYDNQQGISIGKLFGYLKPQFYSNIDASTQDFGLIVIDNAIGGND